jgi:hypothetical protein
MGNIGKTTARLDLQEVPQTEAVPEIVPEQVPPAEYVTAMQDAVAGRLGDKRAGAVR